MTWLNQNILYYTCKAFGLLPFSGNQKYLSFAYSAVVWTILMFHNFRINSVVYEKSQTNSIELKLWMKLVYFEICVKSFTGTVTLLVSAYRSWSFFELLDKFKKFDQFSQETYLSHNRRIQIYYIMYIAFMGIFQYLYILKNSGSHIFWPLHCSLTMLVAVYYVIFVRMMRERYEMVNSMLKNYMDNTEMNTKCIYPREADRLFNKLRCLAKETKQTVFTVHNAVMKSTNIVISKELDIMILNCWNQPIVFDVHGLFDMDYQLIHSILAAVATYVVVCVQIQLAIIEHATHTNLQ
ncbi:uncharacterized protein LOC126835618 isoform X2 [Adelges cooleyi]|uniref:uncharacterized protein LOC126835618 isoform X2 n=1 Tax=Adelges cooleyi TaxID=133065 RepID=UPI002180092C|nr:uncharacterized protein LOC126835618 isoform X2 [Adelges cooleyi]